MSSQARWAEVESAVGPLRRSVLAHRVYRSLHDRRAVQLFMEHHVWAVWDFMSVLTRLQRDLTCCGPALGAQRSRPCDPADGQGDQAR